MKRTVLLLKPEQRKKLSERAKNDNVSVSEIHRRAIDQYLEINSDEITALDMLAEALIQSHQSANESLNEAIEHLDIAIKELKKGNKHGCV